MTNYNDKMLHADRGKRLKQLAKENGLTREKLSKIIGYSETHISRIYSGDCELKEDIAQLLADQFNVRKEYILCEDNFKTEDEMYACIKENDIKDLQFALEYLKSLGLVFKPCMTLYCPLTKIYKNISTLADCVLASEIERIKHEFDFELESADFHRKYFDVWCTLKLSSAPPNLPELSLDSVSKTGDVPSEVTAVCCGSNKNILGVNYDVELYYEVYYKNEFVRKICAHTLQDFVKKLDSFTRCVIQTLMIDGVKTYFPMPEVIE